MTPYIDGTGINNRTDWRHDLVPGPALGRVEHLFPGVAARGVTKGPALPPDIVLTGYFDAFVTVGETNPVDTLLATLATWNAKLGGTPGTAVPTYTVKVGDVEWQNCELIDFRIVGPIEPLGGTPAGVRRMVQIRYRQLAANA